MKYIKEEINMSLRQKASPNQIICTLTDMDDLHTHLHMRKRKQDSLIGQER